MQVEKQCNSYNNQHFIETYKLLRYQQDVLEDVLKKQLNALKIQMSSTFDQKKFFPKDAFDTGNDSHRSMSRTLKMHDNMFFKVPVEYSDKQWLLINKTIESLEMKFRRTTKIANDSLLLKESLMKNKLKSRFTDISNMLTLDRTLGCVLIDTNENRYIDMSMGHGTILFGHTHPVLKEAVFNHFDCKKQLNSQPNKISKISKMISELTGNEGVLCVNNDSESIKITKVMSKLYTGKNKIILFTGANKCHYDEFSRLENKDFDYGVNEIDQRIATDVFTLEYDSFTSIEFIRKHAHEIAAVIIEPVQIGRLNLPPMDFLNALRELTTQNGIILIFDEICTGFRCDNGGVQKLINIRADLTIYGNNISNGLPIGIIAGKREILNTLSDYQTKGSFIHPLSLESTDAILSFFGSNIGTQAILNDKTTALVKNINKNFIISDIPIRLKHYGSIYAFTPLSDFKNMDLFQLLMLDNGLFTTEDSIFYLSLEHSESEIEKIVDVVNAVSEDMKNYGFFDSEVINNESLIFGIPDMIWYD